MTRRFKIAANGGSIIGSFIRGPRARGAHTKSQHYRAMRSAGFAWDVAWAGRWSVHQLGLSWGCVGQPVATEPAYAALFAADNGEYNLVWNRDQCHSRR